MGIVESETPLVNEMRYAHIQFHDNIRSSEHDMKNLYPHDIVENKDIVSICINSLPNNANRNYLDGTSVSTLDVSDVVNSNAFIEYFVPRLHLSHANSNLLDGSFSSTLDPSNAVNSNLFIKVLIPMRSPKNMNLNMIDGNSTSTTDVTNKLLIRNLVPTIDSNGENRNMLCGTSSFTFDPKKYDR